MELCICTEPCQFPACYSTQVSWVGLKGLSVSSSSAALLQEEPQLPYDLGNSFVSCSSQSKSGSCTSCFLSPLRLSAEAALGAMPTARAPEVTPPPPDFSYSSHHVRAEEAATTTLAIPRLTWGCLRCLCSAIDLKPKP